MPRPPPTRLYDFALLLLLAGIVLLSAQLIERLRQQQIMAQDLAELQHATYGLLNANAWVEQIGDILEKKVTDFQLTDENRTAFKRSLERVLETLITEIDRYVRRQNLQGQGFSRAVGKVKQGVQDLLIDMQEVKKAIPEYADIILDELQKPEARKDLNVFLHRVLFDLTASTFAEVDKSELRAIETRHGCDATSNCREQLETGIDRHREVATRTGLIILALTALLFLLARQLPDGINRPRLVMLALAAITLMAAGVLTPMIEVDARISQLHFMLFEEPVVFTNQVLYFQSKSVLDVVAVLAATGAWDMIVVGVLIMVFSVVFPLAKLLASLLLLYRPAGAGSWAMTRFFALKSGKWSMADVMVVAIFMAYIGFDGLIASQLSNFKDAGEGQVDILTTNGTSLQIGFFMFLAFCLANLVASTFIESYQEQATSREAG